MHDRIIYSLLCYILSAIAQPALPVQQQAHSL